MLSVLSHENIRVIGINPKIEFTLKREESK